MATKEQTSASSSSEETVRVVEDFVDGFFAGIPAGPGADERLARLAHGLTRVVEQYRESAGPLEPTLTDANALIH